MRKARLCDCGHKKKDHHWRFFYPRGFCDGRVFCYTCLPDGGFHGYSPIFYIAHKANHGYEYVYENAIPWCIPCVCGHERRNHRQSCFEIIYKNTLNPSEYYCKCKSYKVDNLKYLEYLIEQKEKEEAALPSVS